MECISGHAGPSERPALEDLGGDRFREQRCNGLFCVVVGLFRWVATHSLMVGRKRFAQRKQHVLCQTALGLALDIAVDARQKHHRQSQHDINQKQFHARHSQAAFLEATYPNEAIRICELHDGPIHLLLTDVVMPQMNGPELAERVKRLHRGLKTLYMSGYSAETVAVYGLLDSGTPLLEKPISPKTVATTVREVLGDFKPSRRPGGNRPRVG